jgi:hypothetical protein
MWGSEGIGESVAAGPVARGDHDRPAEGIALREVLAEWRTVERELTGMVANNLERSRVLAEIVALRAAYHRLFTDTIRRYAVQRLAQHKSE